MDVRTDYWTNTIKTRTVIWSNQSTGSPCIDTMASNQEKSIDFSVYGKELSQMSPRVQDVYGSLLNNGMYAFQPQCKMDMDVIRYSVNCHYGLVRLMYFQSPQVAYIDLCLGKELVSAQFKGFFCTGIHRARFPNSLVRDCDVVFHPLVEKIQPDKLYSFAMAIAEDYQLPGMNLNYLHRNPTWNPSLRPKILALSDCDLDDLSL